MSKPQKTLAIIMWLLAILAMIGVLAMRMLPAGSAGESSSDPAPPILYDVPNFTLVDQNANPFSNTQLSGQPWIADFIYTTCPSICPLMSAHMQTLQADLPSQIKLVSFSVDPAHDTPPVLTDYAQKYHAQPGRWIFLTGDPVVQTEVVRAMKLIFQPAQADSPIQHDSHFVLVDAHGHVRGYYDSNTPDQMQNLQRDAKYLCDHPPDSIGNGAGQ
jgi:protein SCO1